MYAEALAQLRIPCTEKIVIKLGLIMVLAVFSSQNAAMDINYTGSILKGYIQKEVISVKEQSNDALFLLKEKWNEQLNKKYGKDNYKVVSEGVIFSGKIKYINSRRIKMNVIEVNRNINKNIEIVPQTASKNLHSKSKINNIANVSEAVAAINGTYFKQDTGTPLGILVINNEIISGPIYERAAFGIGDNDFKTARIGFTGELKSKSKSVKLDNINQPRMMFSQVIIYNSKWGSKSPETKKQCRHIGIKNNKITEISDYPINISQNGYVVSAPKETLKGFKVGDKIEINYKLSEDWSNINHIISGGPYLIKNGEIFIDTSSEKLTGINGRNPRTAIGYTKDNVMILVTIDGRKEGSSGVTITELAKIMKDLNCFEAINLDGGSSTAMYVNGSVYSGTNIKNSVKISNALVIKNKI